MKAATLDEIRQAVHGRWLSVGTAEPQQITKVCIDSRRASLGDLFIAIRGENHDGHDFLHEAAAAGCSGAIVAMNSKVPPNITERFAGGVIGVADTTASLGELAAFHRKSFTGQVVGVTGTVGKSTVKEMVHHILSKRLTGSAAIGSFNNSIGLPLTLLAAKISDDYVVCELGTNSPGEIEHLSRIAQADIPVITAVGMGHLEGFGDIDRVAVEKASILTHVGRHAIAVVNADNRQLNNALKCYDCRRITFGASDEAQMRLTDYRDVEGGCEFQVNQHQWVKLPVLGRHNAMNALAAMTVARRFGFEPAEAAIALADFKAPPMRMEVHRIGAATIINDAYNANPTSMKAAIAVLCGLSVCRRVLVAGDMLELGQQSRDLHRSMGADIARSEIGLLVCVGPLAADIAGSAIAAGMDKSTVLLYDSAEAAAEDTASWLREDDAVLVKASRAVGAEKIVTALIKSL